MIKTAANRRLVVRTVLCLGIATAGAGLVSAQQPRSLHKGELAAVADIVIGQGLDAELPPHISSLLGITQEQKCPVKQGVVRSKGQVQGIDVSTGNHSDIVIFVVDEKSQEQSLYLTSPTGTLRRVVVVKDGVGNEQRPTKTDRDAFLREKQFWENYLGGGTLKK